VASNRIQRKRATSPESRNAVQRRNDGEPDGSASSLIVVIANRLTSGASTVYREAFGVGTIEWRVLSHVAGERWITPQRICRLGGLDKGGVSRSMKFLLDRGLIAVRGSAADARSVELSLTAKGAAMHERMARLAEERERRLLHGLSKPQVRSLVDTLRRLNEQITAVNDVGKRV
jgi:DNA-binding MarR family transcriptional regulator